MAYLLAPLVAALGAAFKWIIASSIGLLLVQLVISLGVGFVTFQGVSASLDWFEGFVTAQLPAAGPVASILGLMGFDVGFSILFSAMGVALTLRTVGGTFRRLTLGSGGGGA